MHPADPHAHEMAWAEDPAARPSGARVLVLTALAAGLLTGAGLALTGLLPGAAAEGHGAQAAHRDLRGRLRRAAEPAGFPAALTRLPAVLALAGLGVLLCVPTARRALLGTGGGRPATGSRRRGPFTGGSRGGSFGGPAAGGRRGSRGW